jgi:hypothetical protein
MRTSLLSFLTVAGGFLSFADLAMGTECHFAGKKSLPDTARYPPS